MTGKTMHDNDFDFDILHTCSTNECTGLIASEPETDEQWDAYHADQKRLDELDD